MSSKLRVVFLTACVVIFLMGAFTRPGASVTRRAGENARVKGPQALEERAAADGTWYGQLLLALADRSIEVDEVGSWYRAVALQNKNSGQEATFRITDDGIVHPQDARALAVFFRCRRSRRHRTMNPGVLAMLVDLSEHFDGHVIEVISGYRARPYGVKNSKHFLGRAIDLRVRDVRVKTVRDYLWRFHRQVGVGYYPHHGFVHMDYRPEGRAAAWTSSRGKRRFSKNPRWARLARR